MSSAPREAPGSVEPQLVSTRGVLGAVTHALTVDSWDITVSWVVGSILQKGKQRQRSRSGPCLVRLT